LFFIPVMYSLVNQRKRGAKPIENAQPEAA
jgi:hypothetical protein